MEDKPSEDRVCKALYRLISFVENDRFCQFEILLREMLFGSKRNMASVEFEKPKHYVYVPRIIVTPTQNYFVQPELVAENRVIRSYGHEHTLRIAFRDEDFSKLQMSSPTGLLDVLNERVVKFLTAGLFLCGRHFEFLACSNSQLRDHGAWLFAPDGKNTAADIRESLGELDKIRCVATYVSRMGQCFSSTKETVKVAIGEGSTVEYIEDVRKDYNGVLFKCCGKTLSGTYTFSDGIGKISKALSKKVNKQTNKQHKTPLIIIIIAIAMMMVALEIMIYNDDDDGDDGNDNDNENDNGNDNDNDKDKDNGNGNDNDNNNDNNNNDNDFNVNNSVGFVYVVQPL